MKKLLIICGPTATGKTALALSLAKQFQGELVSSDSRQVYRGFEVLTGKDLPASAEKEGSAWKVHGVSIWLYDLVEPTTEMSVAQWRAAAVAAIGDIAERSKLPIVVGGTGLYLSSLIKPPETMVIPPNHKLRTLLVKVSLAGLQARLSAIDPEKFLYLNHSDQANPRRLIRAIEVAEWERKYSIYPPLPGLPRDTLWVGLTGDKNVMTRRIAERVKGRWQKAVIEVKHLVNLKLVPQVVTTLGFKLIDKYLSGKLSREEAQSAWVKEEIDYAKRQLTWFKKQKNIHWFDITTRDYQDRVEKLVTSWYTEG